MLSQLWKVARKQVGILQERDEVVGIGIYGSLSYDRVTPFSDIDLFIVTSESEHSPSIEHRVIDGVRADFMWQPLEKWQKIHYIEPRYMPWYMVKGMLLGSDDSIPYDPKGIIKEKCNELKREISYGRFIATYIANDLRGICNRLMLAIWQEEEGNFAQAWDEINRWSTGYLFEILTDLTNHKQVENSIQAIGIPELNEHIQTIRSVICAVNGYTTEYVMRRIESDRIYWEYQLEHIWQPLRKSLITQGVEIPEKLDLNGELMLPYGGVRIYELWRAIMEHSFSLEWAEAELRRGDLVSAIGKVNYEDIVNMAGEKWGRIDKAISEAGYDTGNIVENLLVSSEFQKCTEEARKMQRSPDAIQPTSEHTHDLITAVYEYSRLLSEYLVSNYPDEAKAPPELFSLSRKEIVERCRARESRIDNDIVSIIVSKESAAIKSLTFKSGSNSDLIEIYWNDACLFDLSSISHKELEKKWNLDKEEVGIDNARFIFSQDENYRVTVDISWSETAVTVENSFQLPHPISIDSNIAIGGIRWPKSENDYWATTIGSKVKIGNYFYKQGSHALLYPTNERYFVPEGCWIAAWNEDVNEVCGFTFTPNCGCLLSSGASSDFEFYLPTGESTLRFHVVIPKPSPPYLALQQLACSESPVPLELDKDGKEPRSPITARK